MAKYTDAIGYIRDLESELKYDWFRLACDFAIESPDHQITELELHCLAAIYDGRATYLPRKNVTSPSLAVGQATQVYFLETLSRFNCFKKLQDSFELKLDKQITLIFGHNGSGKSSVCDAFKILANHETPIRPIHNVRMMGTQNTSFNYKFRNDTDVIKWTPESGYGSQSSRIKYFDSSIALKSIRENIEPGSIVELTPFNLNTFDSLKIITIKLKEYFQAIRDDYSRRLTAQMATIRNVFSAFPESSLGILSESSVSNLAEAISAAESFNDENKLSEFRLKLDELIKASSEDGQKLLAIEIQDLEVFLTNLQLIEDSFKRFSEIEVIEKVRLLEEKLKEQRNLNEGLVPKNGTLENFIIFLRNSQQFCSLVDHVNQECPLCRRKNEGSQTELFKKYFELIEGQIERDISSLRETIDRARLYHSKIKDFDLSALEGIQSFNRERKDTIIKDFKELKLGVEDSFNIKSEAKNSLEALRKCRIEVQAEVKAKSTALQTARNSLQDLKIQKINTEKTLNELIYLRLAKENLESLRDVNELFKEKQLLDLSLPKFTPLLKKITDTEKHAHEELVVADFFKRLEAEYRSLSERDISSFGVTLSKKGSQSGVSVLARIGGKEINNILSEGEQRFHSMALFFAELETCKHSVIVFDDPVSSFDYDYIYNYCTRLRDFALKFTDRQIIVLTHNWEFFVNLQQVFNKHHSLTNKISVQVMESCSIVNSYSEKIVDLKFQISSILNQPSELLRSDKETLAARMRRLIESIINSHVFNDQRHQYKQKGSTVSDFQKYTNIVPLTINESTELRDLFGKLSISEHDDPRNAYVNTDRAVFQTRFERILAIETSILARK